MASLVASNEAAILHRVIKPDQDNLPIGAARAILQLDFDDADRARMHELAGKNQEGTLLPDERADLEAYVHVGLVLDLFRAKARLSLKRAETRR